MDTSTEHNDSLTDQYADQECAGCQSGEDCYGWTTETLKCPTRRFFDREYAAFLDSVREYEDENRVGTL